MIIVNFAHPFTQAQLEQLSTLPGVSDIKVVDVYTHFDEAQAFIPQAQALVDSAGLSEQEWNTALINPPSYSAIALLVLADIHGRIGHFPDVLRLRRAGGGGLTQYEIAEVLPLQAVRDDARERTRRG